MISQTRPSATRMVLMLAAVLLVTLNLVTPVSAHFVLNFPPTRGADETTMAQQPCGGKNTVQTTRTSYPIQGGSVQITSEHANSIFAVNFATAAAPTNFLPVAPNTSLKNAGTVNATIDVNTLKAQGVDVGTQGIMQIVYNGGDGMLYQCADIVLTGTGGVSPTAGSGANSTNPNTSTPTPTGSNSPKAVAVAVPSLALFVVTLFMTFSSGLV